MDEFYKDVEAVIDAVLPDRLHIWAWAGSSHLAVRYAVEHPDRILALFLSTPAVSNAVWKPVFMSLQPLENWNLFLRLVSPLGLSAEETAQHVRALRRCMTPQDWVVTSRAGRASDIAADLPRVVTPTLITYSQGSGIPVEETLRFAAMIPKARFIRIGKGYLFGDADQGLAAIDAFLDDLRLRGEGVTSRGPQDLSARELEVLRLLAAGRSNQQIAEALVISSSTVAKHVSSIFNKTGAANRTEAAAYALRHGIA
jgi:DNA-binding CsgD family transcriptional regulator